MKLPRYHRVKYALAGVLLGLGAPLGSLVIRYFLHHNGEFLAGLIHEWDQASFFYIYMTIGCTVMFAIFGFVLGEKGDALEKEKKKATNLAITDGLTGLYNHRYLQEHLGAEFERVKRYGTPLTCLMLDIDNFKEVNDQHGHVFGDHVLRIVARILKEQVRRVDTVGRYGGEEFLILMPHTTAQDVQPLAERIRMELQDYPFHLNGQEIRVTLSIGIANAAPHGPFKDRKSLLEAADAALYRAKTSGKNRIHIWDKPGSEN
jgi:diguanylate cyclase (GGDEF)-like protein